MEKNTIKKKTKGRANQYTTFKKLLNIACGFYNLACIVSLLGEDIFESSEIYVKSKRELF